MHWVLITIMQVVSADKTIVGSTFPGDAEVVNIDTGEKTTASSLYAESPYTLFVLERHYAWPPCNNHTQEVLNSLPEFEQLGCKVVLLSNGTRESGLVWRKSHPYQCPAYCDPQHILYRKLGLRRILKILTTTTVCTYGEMKRKGITFPDLVYEDDDIWIMGGDFIVKNDGKVLLAFHQTNHYERPPVCDLVSCLKDQPAVKWTSYTLYYLYAKWELHMKFAA